MSDYVNSFEDFGIVIPIQDQGKDHPYVKCPQCSHLRSQSHQNLPVLGVSISNGNWGCNHCGWTGRLLTKEEVAKFKFRFIKSKDIFPIVTEESKVAVYWQARGISHDTLMKNQVKAARTTFRDKLTGTFVERNAMVFEYRRYGNLINRKYRDAHKNFRLETDADLVLWGLDHVQKYAPESRSLIITEGEPDKMSYNEVGIWNVVSVPNGATISEAEKKFYDEFKELPADSKSVNLPYLDKEIEYLLEKYDTFYLSTDNDAPGVKLQRELIRRFGKEKCRIINFKKVGTGECKDANEVLCKYGKAELIATITNAEIINPEYVIRAKDTWKELEVEYDFGKEKGLFAGFRGLSNHFRWRLGDMIILNGFPSHGKTVFALNLMLISAMMHDWKWGIYSPENMPAKRIFDMLAEMMVGSSTDKIRTDRMSKTQFFEAVNTFLHDHFFVIDADKIYTPQEMREIQDTLIKLYGVRGFLKDPWNSLKHRLNRSQTLDSYLEEELSQENIFSISRDVITFINVHPPTPKDKTEREAPSPFEITGGKIWYAKAPMMLCIHRPQKKDNGSLSHLHVQKVKNQDLCGVPTTVPISLTFQRANKRYLESVTIGGKDGLLSPLSELYKKFIAGKESELNF